MPDELVEFRINENLLESFVIGEVFEFIELEWGDDYRVWAPVLCHGAYPHRWIRECVLTEPHGLIAIEAFG